MAYIGNTNQTQAFTPAVDYFNGNGSTTAFTLSRPVASVAQIQVVVDNVPQNPSSAYTVSGNTITFTSAPLSGTNNIYVEYTSPITQYNALSQNPSVVGDLTTSGGHYAVGSFNSGYTDGIVVDYTSGLGRVTVGASDATAFYYGGTGSRTESMRIDSSGNVGIGTSSPGSRLDVRTNTTGDTNINVQNDYSGAAYAANVNLIAANTSGSYYNAIVAKNSAGTATWKIDGAGAADTFRISTGSSYTERMRIDSSGNLLFNSGYGSVTTAYGCRAWLSYNGSTASIIASGGISSVTVVSTGVYYATFSFTMPDTSYCVVASKQNSVTNNNVSIAVASNGRATTRTGNIENYENGAATTPAYFYIAVFR